VGRTLPMRRRPGRADPAGWLAGTSDAALRQAVIDLLPLWGGAALFMALVMSVAWPGQRRTRQGGWADAFWSLGLGAAGVGVALFQLDGASSHGRQVLVPLLLGLWGLRLGLHIARRAASEQEDARYARLRQDWGDHFQSRMFGFLMLQAG